MAIVSIAICQLQISQVVHAQESNRKSFWFKPKEIFPIEWGVQNLVNADFDQNGKEDLLLVENNRAKIHLLWNRDDDEPVEITANFGTANVNSLPPDARFKLDAITSERRIIDLAVGDLNGDSFPDIAYFGNTAGLVIHYNKGERKWETAQERVVPNGLTSMNSLDIGDLNGDKANDIILLGEGAAYVFYQSVGGQLEDPVKIPLSRDVKGLQIYDLNNDGYQDLLLLAWASKSPIRIKWQIDGVIGEEVHYKLPSISSYDLADLNNDNISELICIETRSNDACIYQLKEEGNSEFLPGIKFGQTKLLAYDVDGGVGRTFVSADLNNDQLDDLIIPDPQSGQLIYYQQDSNNGFAVSKKFPSLSGITDMATGDWDGDESEEVFVLSRDEKVVGVTKLDELGKIPFPSPISFSGEPLALGFGFLSHWDKNGLILIAENTETSQRYLEIFHNNKSIHKQALNKDYLGTPGAIKVTDADQDGFSDIILLTPYQDLKILRGSSSDFDEIDVPPPGASIDKDSLTVIDINNDKRDELIFSMKNFIRITNLVNSGLEDKPSWKFKVIEQVNGSAANSEIKSPVYIPQSEKRPEILCLLDIKKSQVSFCTKDDSGIWAINKNLTLNVENILGLQTMRYGPSKIATLAFVAENFIAWKSQSNFSKQLSRAGQYQTKINRGKLFDVITGDLNNDGSTDIIFNEAQLNHLEIAYVNSELNTQPGVNWKVFEKQSFRSGPGASGEPREMCIADFDGDKKSDLAILVHDRVIVYLQD